MKKAVFALLLALSANPSTARDKLPAMTALQVQQMQVREFEAPYDVVFASVVSVLQDSGYRIENADKYSGFVGATASSKTRTAFFARKKQTPIVSAFIEPVGKKGCRVRINFVTVKESNYGLGDFKKDELPVLDAAVYSEAFEKISQAVFLRMSIDGPPAEKVAEPAVPKD